MSTTPNDDNTRIARWLDAGDLMDDLCASTDTMLTAFGDQMSPDDRIARRRVIAKARERIDDFFRSED